MGEKATVGDCILDVIMGAGNVEFHPSDSAIIAINGATGKMLCTTRARDQIFGSPIFNDITGDGIPDVFIGGRAAEMKAIKTFCNDWSQLPLRSE